jgi:hypothetical protein
MKSCGVDVGNMQERGQGIPKGRGALGASVRGEGVWNTITGNPGGSEFLCIIGRGNGGKRSCFNPTGCSIDHGKDVGVVLGNLKESNNVCVDMVKTTFWNGDGGHAGGFLLFGKEGIGGTID